MKCQLSGMPECKFGINDKVVHGDSRPPALKDKGEGEKRGGGRERESRKMGEQRRGKKEEGREREREGREVFFFTITLSFPSLSLSPSLPPSLSHTQPRKDLESPLPLTT